MNTQYDTDFEARARSYVRKDNVNARFWRFAKYLATRERQCWGFFIAGLLIGGLIL